MVCKILRAIFYTLPQESEKPASSRFPSLQQARFILGKFQQIFLRIRVTNSTSMGVFGPLKGSAKARSNPEVLPGVAVADVAHQSPDQRKVLGYESALPVACEEAKETLRQIDKMLNG